MQAHRWAQVTDANGQVRESGSDIHDSLLGGELDRPLDLMTALVVSIDCLSATRVRHLERTGGGDWTKARCLSGRSRVCRANRVEVGEMEKVSSSLGAVYGGVAVCGKKWNLKY